MTSRIFRDPAKILEAKQACIPCRHSVGLKFGKTETVYACGKGKIHSMQGGGRCKEYKDRDHHR